MKTGRVILLFGLLAIPLAGAAVTAIQTLDCGGQGASSAHYTANQSVGGVVGISSVVSPQEVVRHGYIGQLTEVLGFTVLAETNELDEGSSQNLRGIATLDDDTALAIEGSDVTWAPTAFPLLSISNSGLVVATNVYENTIAFVTGLYLNIEGTESFLVRDVNDDDFGSYAGDGLPDDWQVGYFGIGSSDAGPTNNVDLDSVDNTGEWVADTIPTDSNSYFCLTRVMVVTNDANVFFESSASRIYSLEFTTNLVLTSWSGVSGQTNQPGVGGELWLTHTNLSAGQSFYRVSVALP